MDSEVITLKKNNSLKLNGFSIENIGDFIPEQIKA